MVSLGAPGRQVFEALSSLVRASLFLHRCTKAKGGRLLEEFFIMTWAFTCATAARQAAVCCRSPLLSAFLTRSVFLSAIPRRHMYHHFSISPISSTTTGANRLRLNLVILPPTLSGTPRVVIEATTSVCSKLPVPLHVDRPDSCFTYPRRHILAAQLRSSRHLYPRLMQPTQLCSTRQSVLNTPYICVTRSIARLGRLNQGTNASRSAL